MHADLRHRLHALELLRVDAMWWWWMHAAVNGFIPIGGLLVQEWTGHMGSYGPFWGGPWLDKHILPYQCYLGVVYLV